MDFTRPTKENSILVVDDESDVCEVLSDIIIDIDPQTQVVQASGGAEALSKMGNQPFRLLISDLSMPGMDGLEMLKKIKTIPKDHRPQYIVIISGVSDKLKEVSQYNLPVTVLEKPLQMDLFQNLVKKALGQSVIIDYQRLSAEQALEVSQIFSFSFYIESSNRKKIKIISKGDVSYERLQEYREKGHTHFYVKKIDYEEYLTSIGEKVGPKHNSSPAAEDS